MNAGASAAPSRGFRYPLSLLAIFAAWWAGMAIKPWDRHDWVLENVLAVLFVANAYLNLYSRLRVDITSEKKEIEVKEKEIETRDKQIEKMECELAEAGARGNGR